MTLAALAVLGLSSCDATVRAARVTHPRATTTTAATTTTVATTTAATTTVPPTTAARAPAPTTAAHVMPSAPPTTRPPAPLLVTRLAGVGTANQVIAVDAAGYGQTTATFSAYQRVTSGWQQVFGPWQAHVGYNGFAPPGQKHEGDGRTPSGSYGFDFFFGVLADPGVQFPWRAVTGTDIVWDDDPSSPSYNQWVDRATTNAGASPEPMDQTPAYDYGAVIAYNASPVVPGAGSAIFLHVTTGGPTAGCVSLPVSDLLAVLRWLNPAAQPRIIMGTTATIAP